MSLTDLSNELLAYILSHVEANLDRPSDATPLSLRQPVIPVTGEQLARFYAARQVKAQTPASDTDRF